MVIDDRQEFANKELFPRAKQVICAPFVEALANLELGPSSFVVLATRGHQYDYECLRVLLPKTLAYLGMVGSRKKVQELKQVLEKEGFPPDRLEALHAPIGIPIGALTPAEIGVSILAEIIAEKRRLFPAEETNREVLAAAAELEAAGKQGIMVTIVKTRGSTPRKAGARMLVYPGEQVIGTIGGGKGEAAAKGQALLALAEGENRLCHLDMTNSAAGEEGMVCGGSMDLVLENMALLRAGETC